MLRLWFRSIRLALGGLALAFTVLKLGGLILLVTYLMDWPWFWVKMGKLGAAFPFFSIKIMKNIHILHIYHQLPHLTVYYFPYS